MENKLYLKLLSVLTFGLPLGTGNAHGLGPWGVQPLEWPNAQISQVTAMGHAGSRTSLQGKDCITGNILNFNVRDEYAFDIDETVWLDVQFYAKSPGAKVSVTYHRNDLGATSNQQIQLAVGADDHWYQRSIALERARFANLGHAGSDFSLSTVQDFRLPPTQEVAICSLTLRRSYTTPVPTVFGWVAIEVLDEKREPTAARMGIYDESGRLAFPANEALLLQTPILAGAARIISLDGVSATWWPVKNRSVFFTDGRYHTRLPVGTYELVVAKGPEYRLARRRFIVKAKETNSMDVSLQRWTDMAAKGWYSGDGHIHYPRGSSHDDRNLQVFSQAADLRVANILQMGNSARMYFPHHDWHPVSADNNPSFVLVPGQEDPRTSHRGHTVQLNIKAPVRNAAHYMLYHEVFEKVRAQGGLSGYAHLTPANEDIEGIKVTRGMALDVPFKLVDFVEVLTGAGTDGGTWFDFLNLGYKLSPAAGTDYMGGGEPGYVRNYVRVGNPFVLQAWFDGLKTGRTFVTNGPMLEVSVNGKGMGSELHLKKGEPLSIRAQAAINPDIGALGSVELIEQGEVIKEISSSSGEPEMDLRHDLRAVHGTWLVVRARGKNPDVTAYSAPVYVFVDGQDFWKPAKVPAIVAKLKVKMQELMPLQPEIATEAWETREPDSRYWGAQEPLLRKRIEKANAIYDDLVKRATAERR